MSSRSNIHALTTGQSRLTWFAWVVGLGLTAQGLAVHLHALPYTTDELQYLAWSKDLAWGYFSKPPGIAAAIRLWTFVDPQTSQLRLLAQICYGLSLAVSFKLLMRGGLSSTKSWVATLILGSIPLIGFAQWFFTTDALLLLCWLLSLVIAWEALQASSPRIALRYWALLGIVIGLGTLCKHFMLFFWLGLAIHLAILGYRSRDHLAGVLLALSVFVLIISPHLLWLMEHPGTTLKHLTDLQASDTKHLQMSDRLASLGMHALHGVEFLLAQWLGLGVGMMLMLRQKVAWTPLQRWLLASSLPILGIFVMQALLSHAYANWALPATFTLGLALLARYLNANDIEAQGEAGRGSMSVLFVWAMSNLLMSFFIAFGAQGLKYIRPDAVVWIDRLDPFHRQRGWDTFGQHLLELRKPPDIAWGVQDRDTASRILYQFGEGQLLYQSSPNTKLNHYAMRYADRASLAASRRNRDSSMCLWQLRREAEVEESNRQSAIAKVERQRLSGRAEVWLVLPESCR